MNNSYESISNLIRLSSANLNYDEFPLPPKRTSAKRSASVSPSGKKRIMRHFLNTNPFDGVSGMNSSLFNLNEEKTENACFSSSLSSSLNTPERLFHSQKNLTPFKQSLFTQTPYSRSPAFLNNSLSSSFPHEIPNVLGISKIGLNAITSSILPSPARKRQTNISLPQPANSTVWINEIKRSLDEIKKKNVREQRHENFVNTKIKKIRQKLDDD